jgi:hypothetical protein
MGMMAMGGGMPGGMGGGMPGGMGGGGGFGGGMPGGAGGGFGGGAPGGGGPGGGGGRGGGGMAGMGAMMQDLTPEQQTKVKEVMAKAFGGKNPMEMSSEDRTKAFAKVRDEVRKITGRDMPARGGAAGAGGAGGAGGRRGGPGGGGAPGEAGGRPQMALRVGEMPKFEEIAPPPPRRTGPPEITLSPEIANAKLPPPPEQDSTLEVLLRPGLLADVEIIVEKVPNAINIPNQAVFDRNGKMVVYVKDQKGKFEERVIKPLRRSESVMIIESGVKPGETIALADPNAKPGDQKKKGGGGSGASGAPAGMPGMGKGSR